MKALSVIAMLMAGILSWAALTSARETKRHAAVTVRLRPVLALDVAGTRRCVTAIVRSATGRPGRHLRVLFAVPGANSARTTRVTDVRGHARFCFRGTAAGNVAIRAVVDVNGDRRPERSEPAAVATQIYSAPARPAPPATRPAPVAPSPPAAGVPVGAPPALQGPEPVIAAAGDIASSSTGAAATAALLDAVNPDAVLALGDNAYSGGSPVEYATRYAPTWGVQALRTHPVPGNHDYDTPGAAGYFGYFGAAAAGVAGTGYYSYDLGAWHLVALNSNCTEAGGCAAGSPQEQWLRADLAAHPAACTLAYWHHARFSSGMHGSHTAVEPLWQALYEAGADVILNAHDHDYERFAPQTPTGTLDAAAGLREFVVGTGGGSHYTVGTPIANSEVTNGDTFGVLELTLQPTGYDWRFIPEAGRTFTDAGSGACH